MFSYMATPVLVDQQIVIFTLSLCADIGCHVEDLQRPKVDRDGWQERFKGILTAGMPWLWYCIFSILGSN